MLEQQSSKQRLQIPEALLKRIKIPNINEIIFETSAKGLCY